MLGGIPLPQPVAAPVNPLTATSVDPVAGPSKERTNIPPPQQAVGHHHAHMHMSVSGAASEHAHMPHHAGAHGQLQGGPSQIPPSHMQQTAGAHLPHSANYPAPQPKGASGSMMSMQHAHVPMQPEPARHQAPHTGMNLPYGKAAGGSGAPYGSMQADNTEGQYGRAPYGSMQAPPGMPMQGYGGGSSQPPHVQQQPQQQAPMGAPAGAGSSSGAGPPPSASAAAASSSSGAGAAGAAALHAMLSKLSPQQIEQLNLLVKLPPEVIHTNIYNCNCNMYICVCIYVHIRIHTYMDMYSYIHRHS
jgi:hypothetical protein